MNAVRLLCSLLLALTLSSPAFALLTDELPAGPPAGTQYTAKSTGGTWNAGSTWTTGLVPGPGSVVFIPAGVTVTIDHIAPDPAAAPKWVQVAGILNISTTTSTRFYAETIYVTSTGTLQLGTETSPLPNGRTAEIIFTSSGAIDKNWDREQISRGLVAEGKVKVFGVSRTYAAAVNQDAPAGTQTLTLAVTPSNWQIGDELVVTGTYFRRGRASEEEVRTISSISGNVVTLNSPLSKNHIRVATAGQSPLNFHVANLTRNVIFRSNSTATIEDRGHIILNHLDTQVQWVALLNLGRTDKSRVLNDFVLGPTSITKQTDPWQVTNRRGRYSLHIHKAGWGSLPYTTVLTNVTGCVVNNTPGWGFVNHGSNVDFRRNVAYDFFGAGFVTEDGTELGYFVNNIAIKGRGTGEFQTRKERINFAHPQRKQPLADFGFMGDGFWFNGPAIRVNGAIATGCNGRGMIWHTTGAVNPGDNTDTFGNTYPYGRYSFFPKNQIANVYSVVAGYEPRTWKDGSATSTNRAVIADLPILQATNIESYANFIGIHFRFNNHNSNAWYTENPFDYDNQILKATGEPDNVSIPVRMREAVSNLKLWNNEEALAARYASYIDFTTVTAINRLDYDEKNTANDPSINPIYGMEIFHIVNNITFTGLLVDGWDVAINSENISNDPVTGATVTTKGGSMSFGTPVLRNFALTETWDVRTSGATPCSQPILGTVSVAATKTSATLNWSGTSGKFLLRYRIDGTQPWTYVEPASRPWTVTTTPSKNYSWQVMGGCDTANTVSNWTPRGTFSTF